MSTQEWSVFATLVIFAMIGFRLLSAEIRDLRNRTSELEKFKRVVMDKWLSERPRRTDVVCDGSMTRHGPATVHSPEAREYIITTNMRMNAWSREAAEQHYEMAYARTSMDESMARGVKGANTV